jgi:hypothetical protein
MVPWPRPRLTDPQHDILAPRRVRQGPVDPRRPGLGFSALPMGQCLPEAADSPWTCLGWLRYSHRLISARACTFRPAEGVIRPDVPAYTWSVTTIKNSIWSECSFCSSRNNNDNNDSWVGIPPTVSEQSLAFTESDSDEGAAAGLAGRRRLSRRSPGHR